MTDEPKSVQNILTFEKMLELSEMAKSRPAPTYVMCGVQVWRGVRELAEGRLAHPLCADILTLDGSTWMMSLNVEPGHIMMVDQDDVVCDIPLVISRPAVGDFDG